MNDCCNHKKTAKKCRRKKDNKTFKLPRRFSKKKCLKGVKGFTMRSSCAPYKGCKKGGGIGFSKCDPRKHPGVCENPRPDYMSQLPPDLVENIISKSLTDLDIEGKIRQIEKKIDIINEDIIFTEDLIDDDDDDVDMLFRDLDKLMSKKSKLENKKRKLVNQLAEMDILVKNLKSGGKSKKTKKKSFLFNPNNPKKSFDVYVDKDPTDTIPIKYTTVDDVKKTIKKLERLYKSNKYPHKRIWQVGMIMYVRLKVLKKKKPKEYKLAKKYFLFLKNRTKVKDESQRKKLVFKNFNK